MKTPIQTQERNRPERLFTPTDMPVTRFLSRAECDALAKRAATMAVGGGDTAISIESTWIGNLRYARNEITTTGDIRENDVVVIRDIMGASDSVICTSIDDVGLEAAVRRAERKLRLKKERGERVFREHLTSVDVGTTYGQSLDTKGSKKESELSDALEALMQTEEEISQPKIFFDTTYGLGAPERVKEVGPLITAARQANLRAAGYIQVSAHGRAVINTVGRALYYPYTQAQFSVTVRDPKGTSSGWAGIDFNDWSRINPMQLTEIAMDKCLRSRNAVAVEPGRYTTILEPQAVSDIFSSVVFNIWRLGAENGQGPFADPNRKGWTKIGQRVLDPRITVSADPMDPDLGFPPFDRSGYAYHAVDWIKDGVLKELAYQRWYAIKALGINRGLPSSGAYRMSGGNSSIEDMIATTKRGLLVTRFSGVQVIDRNSLMSVGYTRDGLWLIENGKISKPVKNFRFMESPLFIFNNLEELGTPVRVFRPGYPTVVPPAKVRDFNFVSLSEAV
jgi:predicted Zn-dependent protease